MGEVKFSKGPRIDMPEAGVEGRIIITNDTGEMYLDTGDNLVPIGKGRMVDDLQGFGFVYFTSTSDFTGYNNNDIRSLTMRAFTGSVGSASTWPTLYIGRDIRCLPFSADYYKEKELEVGFHQIRKTDEDGELTEERDGNPYIPTQYFANHFIYVEIISQEDFDLLSDEAKSTAEEEDLEEIAIIKVSHTIDGEISDNHPLISRNEELTGEEDLSKDDLIDKLGETPPWLDSEKEIHIVGIIDDERDPIIPGIDLSSNHRDDDDNPHRTNLKRVLELGQNSFRIQNSDIGEIVDSEEDFITIINDAWFDEKIVLMKLDGGQSSKPTLDISGALQILSSNGLDAQLRMEASNGDIVEVSLDSDGDDSYEFNFNKID